MPETENRFLHVRIPGTEEPVIRLDADPAVNSVGNIIAGGHDANGSLLLFRSGATDITEAGASAISIRASNMDVRFRRPEPGFPVSMELIGGLGKIFAGGAPNTSAEIVLRGAAEENDGGDLPPARIRLVAQDPVTGDASVTVGASKGSGTLRMVDGNGQLAVVISSSGTGPEILLGNESIRLRVSSLFAPTAEMSVGGSGFNGSFNVRSSPNANDTTFNVSIVDGRFTFGRDNQTTMRFDGDAGNIRCGGSDTIDGDLLLFPPNADIDVTSQATVHLDGGGASMRLGTTGNEGNISVRDASDREVFQFDAGNAVLRIGTTENEGDLIVRDGENREVFHVDGNNAVLRVGTTGNEGNISVRDASDREVFQFDAENAVLRIGSQGNEGDIICRDDNGNESIHLNGGTGDIILQNADCAEDFDVADSTDIEPGTVVVIDENGELHEAGKAYERTVMGVISGAGEYKPGIRLDRRETGKTRLPVALVGKVYCKADAAFGAIRVGDLLTTSPTPGQAMKASDPARAFGAVIGKALEPLSAGTGIIQILVALQ